MTSGIISAARRLAARSFAIVTPIAFILFVQFCCGAQAGGPADLFREAAATPSERSVDHSAWDGLLKIYVKAGEDGLNRVDYAVFKTSGQDALEGYIARLESVDPAVLDRAEQFAFLANLYNAKTIAIVLEKYPVKSIKDISLGGGFLALVAGGPWKAKVLKLQGVSLGLDDVEHGVLRAVFKDPRVHYSLNCASIGRPNLQTEAFAGAKLDAQLDAAARAYVNHPRGVSIGPRGVVVSSIYRWFQADFGGDDAGVLKHLRAYAEPELRKNLEMAKSISGDAYDWRLNDTAR